MWLNFMRCIGFNAKRPVPELVLQMIPEFVVVCDNLMLRPLAETALYTPDVEATYKKLGISIPLIRLDEPGTPWAEIPKELHAVTVVDITPYGRALEYMKRNNIEDTRRIAELYREIATLDDYGSIRFHFDKYSLIFLSKSSGVKCVTSLACVWEAFPEYQKKEALGEQWK